MNLILPSLIVFGITLILTKSKILAGKREFVEKRYESSKVGDMKPNFVHRWWHAMFHCPMCSGFWVAIPVCWLVPYYTLWTDVIAVFGLNWLIHCLENCLYHSGEKNAVVQSKGKT